MSSIWMVDGTDGSWFHSNSEPRDTAQHRNQSHQETFGEIRTGLNFPIRLLLLKLASVICSISSLDLFMDGQTLGYLKALVRITIFRT